MGLPPSMAGSQSPMWSRAAAVEKWLDQTDIPVILLKDWQLYLELNSISEAIRAQLKASHYVFYVPHILLDNLKYHGDS